MPARTCGDRVISLSGFLASGWGKRAAAVTHSVERNNWLRTVCMCRHDISQNTVISVQQTKLGNLNATQHWDRQNLFMKQRSR